MRQRCNNPNSREFKYYGQRGIRVCHRWSGQNGFKHFVEGMGPQLFPRASVHRINNNGGHTPCNIVWANPKLQARHMRSNRVLVYKGNRMILVA